MEANSSHTDRHQHPGLAQDVQRRPCDEARSEHEYLAAQVRRFQISNASFWLIAVSMASYF
jgi:hypothetical protein